MKMHLKPVEGALNEDDPAQIAHCHGGMLPDHLCLECKPAAAYYIIKK